MSLYPTSHKLDKLSNCLTFFSRVKFSKINFNANPVWLKYSYSKTY